MFQHRKGLTCYRRSLLTPHQFLKISNIILGILSSTLFRWVVLLTTRLCLLQKNFLSI
nr:MAG TPA: hypothetical protein [Caudoviricetes sp.]